MSKVLRGLRRLTIVAKEMTLAALLKRRNRIWEIRKIEKEVDEDEKADEEAMPETGETDETTCFDRWLEAEKTGVKRMKLYGSVNERGEDATLMKTMNQE